MPALVETSTWEDTPARWDRDNPRRIRDSGQKTKINTEQWSLGERNNVFKTKTGEGSKKHGGPGKSKRVNFTY